MRKVTKKVLCIFTAAAISAGALSLAACGGNSFSPVDADNSGAVESNGGFVVSTKDYYYFINGVEDYSSDNTYGDVVKGALMRIKKADAEAKKNTAETVVPSLMVAADYTSGLYIYGDRIYYATPNNTKSTTGVIEYEYLDFKSVKTDGTDVRSITRNSSNSVIYRFIEKNGTVYLVYVEGTELHSYNTATNVDTVLVDGGTYVFHDSDKSDAYVYYTMSVSDQQDTDNAVSYNYNQIYRVSVDATESYYDYTWDQDWLDENNDGEAPYVNYGELVLDGISKTDNATQFNPDMKDAEEDARPAIGYTYTLQSYENDGIYFTRKLTSVPGTSAGSSGELYYLPVSALDGEWNTIKGNNADELDVVANATNTTKANSSALFYLDEDGGHHYVYVSGQYIYRADVNEDGSNGKEQEIAYNVSGAELTSLDRVSDDTYEYVYFSRTNGSGVSVERAVINGEEENYKNLQFEDRDNAPYVPVKLLDVQHASGWYPVEILDNNLFYVNAETFGSSLNYVYTVNLKNDDGLMNNEEIEALNEKYNAVFSEDSKVGYLAQVKTEGNANFVSTNYSNALKYYFYTGETTQFYENIQEAVDAGYKETRLYSVTEQDAFKAFTAEDSEERAKFNDEDGANYFSLAYFTTFLGEMNEADTETYDEYWRSGVLQSYTAEETEEEGLAWWAWLLIGIAIAAVAAGAAAGVILYRKKRKTDDAPKVEKMRVDTTDDRNVDVYHTDTAEGARDAEPAEEEPVEETVENPAEEPVTEDLAAEEPAVEAAEEVVEEAAEEAEPAPEEQSEATEETEEKPQE